MVGIAVGKVVIRHNYQNYNTVSVIVMTLSMKLSSVQVYPVSPWRREPQMKYAESKYGLLRRRRREKIISHKQTR